MTHNIDGYEGTYKTLEFSANKRYSQPLVDERVVLVHLDPRVRQQLLQQPLRHGGASNFSLFGSYPSKPNEKTQNEYTELERQVRRARSTPAGACA